MKLTVGQRLCADLDTSVFDMLLSFYPEENLKGRKVIAEALRKDRISFTNLKSEADTLFIPWQMFFLNKANLKRHFLIIEKERKDKIKNTPLGSRSARSGPAPYRLIDRFIRSQNFLSSNPALATNTFAGSLKGKSIAQAVDHIINHFHIDRNKIWLTFKQKQTALNYLVSAIESKNINIAFGIGENRIVPSSDNHKLLYKNISGFCLRDAKVPFIFVNSSMATEEEPVGRQIYTFAYLLAMIGMDMFTYVRISSPRSVTSMVSSGDAKRLHAIASEFLMPSAELTAYRGTKITKEIVNTLSDKFKITPSAVLFRLKIEGYVNSREEKALEEPPHPKKSGPGKYLIENAAKKLNGRLVFDAVNASFKSGQVSQNQAQYILFGRINRTAWREYRKNTGL